MNSWFKEIDRARSKAEVVSTARDYCALLHPRDLASLPPDCRAMRIDTDADIARLQQRLSQEYAVLGTRATEVETLRDLVSYLSHASERLGALRTP